MFDSPLAHDNCLPNQPTNTENMTARRRRGRTTRDFDKCKVREKKKKKRKK